MSHFGLTKYLKHCTDTNVRNESLIHHLARWPLGRTAASVMSSICSYMRHLEIRPTRFNLLHQIGNFCRLLFEGPLRAGGEFVCPPLWQRPGRCSAAGFVGFLEPLLSTKDVGYKIQPIRNDAGRGGNTLQLWNMRVHSKYTGRRSNSHTIVQYYLCIKQATKDISFNISSMQE